MRRIWEELDWTSIGGSALSAFWLRSAGVGALSSEPLYTKRARAQSLPPLSDPSIVLRYYLTHPFSFASSREAIYLIYRLFSPISCILDSFWISSLLSGSLLGRLVCLVGLVRQDLILKSSSLDARILGESPQSVPSTLWLFDSSSFAIVHFVSCTWYADNFIPFD